MNHNFRVVWNHASGCYTAVQETAKGRSKSSRTSRALTRWALASTVLAFGAAAQAAPPLTVGDVAGSNVTYTAPAGQVTEVGEVLIGRDTGSDGQVVVSGAGTQLNITPETAGTTPLVISQEGGGTLSVLEGAKVVSTGSAGTQNYIGAKLAYEKSGRLAVNGAGSSFSSNVGLILGNTGAADMFITGGGLVDIESMTAGVGGLGTGSVILMGQDSRLNVRQDVVLGAGNGTSGSIFVDSNGAFSAGGSVVAGAAGHGALVARGGGQASVGDLSVGSFQGGRGYVEFSGAGTHLQNNGKLVVGGSNSVSPAGSEGAAPVGELFVLEGASVTTTGPAVLGVDAGVSGTATVEGAGSQWTVGQGLTVGQSGQGQLTLRNGAAAQAADVVVGANAGSVGGIEVSGGSVLAADSISAGAGGATLLVSDSTVRANKDNPSFINGFASGSNGVQIAGTATFDTQGHQVGMNANVLDAPGASGRFVKDGAGTLSYTGAGNWTHGTEIRQGTLELGNGLANGSLGQGDVLNNGKLQFNQADNASFGNNISGTGDVVKVGSTTLTLNGANSYTGSTQVAQGTLQAGAVDTFSPGSAIQVAAGATLDLAGNNQRIAGLSNAGTVRLSAPDGAAGTRLTVTGPVQGNGGTVFLGTRLGNDASPSDQLVMDGAGAVASGKTNVVIENRSGLGALTTGPGIPVVVVQNGAAAAEGTFTLGNAGGHVDAGAYEYRMTEAAGTRYLRSTAIVPPVEPEPPVEPNPPVTPEPPVVNPKPPVTPEPPVDAKPAYRSEVALHAALPQLVRQGDLAMLSNYHRRIGLPDELGRVGWFRVIGGNLDVRQDGPAASHVDADYAGVQMGVDLLVQPAWKLGVFGGLQTLHGDVDGNASGIQRDVGFVKKDSRYIGAYATWAGDGYYVDGVLQSGRHHLGTAAPLSHTHGDASSTTASIEVGKAFDVGSVKVEPQAQLIYNRARFDDVEIPAATVHQDASSQVIGRLGVKVHTRMQTAAGELQPYGRVNLWHGFGGHDTTTFLNSAAVTPILSSSGFTTVELAAGFNLKVSPIASVYGEVGTAFGAGGGTKVKSSVSGSVGLKFSF